MYRHLFLPGLFFGLWLCYGLTAAELPTNEVNERTKNYWAFRPVEAMEPPSGGDAAGQKNPADRFVYHRLAEAGLTPNGPASKRDWIRRATYDLTGLPPSIGDVRVFEADKSPEAYGRVVDRLLASNHYGEKWGRHWLDLVRYAQSNGYERDGEKFFIWRYRDYVIRSFNEDKPFDRFTMEQLAGDELDDPSVDTLIATGYQRLPLWDDEPIDAKLGRYEYFDSIVSTTSEVFLGLTVGCGRCHDHKIDPIPQKDYYRLVAFFSQISEHGNVPIQLLVDVDAQLADTDLLPGDLVADARLAKTEWAYTHEKPGEGWAATSFDDAGWKRGQAPFAGSAVPRTVGTLWEGGEIWMRRKFDVKEKRPRLMLSTIATTGNAEVWINGELAEKITPLGFFYRDIPIEKFIPKLREKDNVVAVYAPPHGGKMHIMDVGLTVRDRRKFMTVQEWPWGESGYPIHVLYRGNPNAPGEEVTPGFLSVLSPPEPKIVPRGKTSGRRHALAEWIVDPTNPLTPRVTANRIWQYHFGRGIVRTSSNFGLLGEPPTHPELLDWLAAEFVRQGWRFKSIHKLIMLSQAYRMSSAKREDAYEKDPKNDLFWRFDPRRLTAEEVRDSILVASGKLNRKIFGPSFFSVLPPEVVATSSSGGTKWGTSPPEETYRRAIYMFLRRSLKDPLMTGFDLADTDASCAVRFTPTVPTQALTLLNSAFANEQAVFLAGRLRAAASSPEEQVRRGIEMVLSRVATDVDIKHGVELLDRFRKEHQLEPHQALERFALLLINLNEFLYLD